MVPLLSYVARLSKAPAEPDRAVSVVLARMLPLLHNRILHWIFTNLQMLGFSTQLAEV